MKRIIYVITTGVLLFFLLFSPGCFNPPQPPNKKILSVPYYSQVLHTYCAAACLQMWAEYDGFCHTQDEIAAVINVGPCGAAPYDVVAGVQWFTMSPGYLAALDEFELGAQGDLVSSCIEGVKNSVPSIMPFYAGTHAVLITGFEWDEPEDRPIAEFVYYNDPDPMIGEKWGTGAEDLKNFYFTTDNGIYYVILGEEWFFYSGRGSHDDFVLQRGTYYGGPSVYDPKGLLNIDPLPEN